MTRITTEAEAVLRRVVQMSKLVPSVERHLLADQTDAVGPRAAGGGDGGRGTGISDPTPDMVRQLAGFAHQERQLYRALGRVDRMLNEVERDIARILAGNEPVDDAGIRCPGWNAELRARLGGCGKPIEHWTDANGVQHNRSSLLCVGCRKAEQRAKRDEEAA